MDEANRVPFDFQDLFPLVGGDYTLTLLFKNEISKEFTSVEQTLRVPGTGTEVQMTQPLLGYKAVRLEPAPPFSAARGIGRAADEGFPGRSPSDLLPAGPDLFAPGIDGHRIPAP
jgi:hypothetical protein